MTKRSLSARTSNASSALREIFPAASPRRTLLPLSATRLFFCPAPHHPGKTPFPFRPLPRFFAASRYRRFPARRPRFGLLAYAPRSSHPEHACNAPRPAPLRLPPQTSAAPPSLVRSTTYSENIPKRLPKVQLFPPTLRATHGAQAFCGLPGKSPDFPFRRLTFLKAVYIRISRYRVISKGRHDGILSRTSRRTHVQGRNNSRTGLPSYLIHAGKKPVRQARAFSFLFTSSCRTSRFGQEPCPAGTTAI